LEEFIKLTDITNVMQSRFWL